MLENVLSQVSRLDEKNRYYIIGGVVVLTFLIDYFCIMSPQMKTLRTLNPKLTALQTEVATAKSDISQINQYRQDVAKFKEQLEKASRRIINKEEVNWVIESISRMASEEKVKIDQIMPIKGSETVLLKTKEEKYYSLPIMVNARAGYHDLGRFLNRIENGDVFLSVNDFSFVSSGDDTLRHVIKVTFRVIIYDKTEESESK